MKSLLSFLLVATLLLSCRSNSPKTETLQEALPAEITAVNNGDVEFDSYFLGKTMRMDFFHTGKTGEEMFAVDRVVSDGDWGGSKKILIARLEQRGVRCLRIRDPARTRQHQEEPPAGDRDGGSFRAPDECRK